jgi:hypothetical protein
MAVAVRTAGVTTYNWGTGANPDAQNFITTTGDKGVVVAFAGYTTGGFDVSAVTLNGLTPDDFSELQGTLDLVGTCVATWLAPAIGTLALDPLFDMTITDGPTCIACPLTATDVISVIGSDCDSFEGNGVASATAASGTGDLALAFAQNYNSAPTIGGTGAANVTGASQTQNGQRMQGFTVTAGASTSTATSTGDTYPTVALVVLRDGGAAATSYPIVSGSARSLRRNPVYRMSPGGIYQPTTAFSFAL